MCSAPSSSPPSQPPLVVVLAFPSALWNKLLAEALAQWPGLEPLDAAMPTPRAPHVLLSAVEDCRADWQRLARLARTPYARLLVVGDPQPQLAARALRLGACGYVDRSSPLTVLVEAVRGVAAGELWADPRMALGLLRRSLQPPRPEHQALTPREIRVLTELAQGKRNKEIAQQLSISETTVKSHLNRAYRKLQLGDRLQAALYVERHGLDAEETSAANRMG